MEAITEQRPVVEEPGASKVNLATVGLIGGTLSGLLGVGGGVIMVPLLTLWLGYSQRIAHATSMTAIIPISIGGILTYGGAGEINYLWAGCLALGSVTGAPIGARILVKANDRALKMAFGVFLVLVAIAMVAR